MKLATIHQYMYIFLYVPQGSQAAYGCFAYFRGMNGKFLIPAFSALLMLMISCGGQQQKQTTHMDGKKANHLIHESSPYLLQHAYNPVDWYPWGEEALEKAKKENKLILVSIGYAACHWCHVMEHESFEDSVVAAQMNQHFVNIKVDREERPDIDDIYMTACQMSNGRGCGWPLNCFALPNGQPVWAGTYFPKDQWQEILDYFQKLYKEDPAKLEENAAKLTQGIKSIDDIQPVEEEIQATESFLQKITGELSSNMDLIEGGRSGAPKFPMPNGLMFLLKAQEGLNDPMAKKAALVSLDKMAQGGIYDHLGGGFARYSVDDKWLVPHFEKMLYDNGQLLSAYADAYKITSSPLYAEVIDETIEFLSRELMSEEYGFYSSLDADSEGEEGKFYVWSEEEIDSIIQDPKALEWFKDYYNISKRGNWEHGKNILHVKGPLTSIKNYQKDLTEKAIENAKLQLFEARASRVRPGLDDKVLCSWNALALKGLVDSYEATSQQSYLDLAVKNAQFLQKTFVQDDHRLQRNYKDGKTAINGFLDDYALLADAYIALYQVTFDEKWLDEAKDLMEYAHDHFYDEKSGFYFYTSDMDPELVARKKELADNVIPGSNSVTARVLYKLGIFYDNQQQQEQALQMLAGIKEHGLNSGQPGYYSNWATLYYEVLFRPYEIAIVGDNALNLAHEFQTGFHPDALFLGGKDEGSLSLLENKLQEGRTMIYVCQNRVCKFPVDNVEDAVQLMK